MIIMLLFGVLFSLCAGSTSMPAEGVGMAGTR